MGPAPDVLSSCVLVSCAGVRSTALSLAPPRHGEQACERVGGQRVAVKEEDEEGGGFRLALIEVSFEARCYAPGPSGLSGSVQLSSIHLSGAT